jgi:tRNA threonylcarbamoyladenosine biosynthesis protein TsaB
MKLLALDTSTVACTAGLLVGDEIIVRHAEKEREHTNLLVPQIRSLLDEAALEPRDLDAIVLGNGPGSFIGMRIAASVASGLAFGAGLRIVPVSSLAAVAARAGIYGQPVAVAQDAHMGEVYLGIYRRTGTSSLEALVAERLQAPARIPELEGLKHCLAAGAGWSRYPALFRANRWALEGPAGVLYPHAENLLRLGAAAYSGGGGIAPQELSLAYMRHQVARKPGEPAP